jgi:hypothetical protein
MATGLSSSPDVIPGLRFRGLAAILLPVEPRSSILRHIRVAILLCQLCSSTAPDTRLAIEYNLFRRIWLVKAKLVFELIIRHEDGVRRGFDRNVDRAGYVAFFVLCRLPNVCVTQTVSKTQLRVCCETCQL